MIVAEQVIVIFCGVRGYLDDIDLSEIKNFVKKVYEKVKSSNPEIIQSIQSTGKLEDKTDQQLKKIIEEFKLKNIK